MTARVANDAVAGGPRGPRPFAAWRGHPPRARPLAGAAPPGGGRTRSLNRAGLRRGQRQTEPKRELRKQLLPKHAFAGTRRAAGRGAGRLASARPYVRPTRHRVLALFVAALGWPGARPALGQDAAGESPPYPSQTSPFRYLRYEEDWSALRDPANRIDAFDRLKAIRLDDGVYVSLGGMLRVDPTAYFAARGITNKDSGSDDLVFQRVMANADMRIGENLRAFIELKSGHQNFGRDPAQPFNENALDLHQAFADLSGRLGAGIDGTLRLGREELFFGSGRLIEAREGVAVRLSFDAVRATLKADGWTVDGFAARPVLSRAGVFDDRRDPGQTLSGLYATGPVAALPANGLLDLYGFRSTDERRAYSRGTGSEERYTLGVRASNQPGHGADYDMEAAFQFGRFGGKGIRAWTVQANVGFTFDAAPLDAGRRGQRRRRSGQPDPGHLQPALPEGGLLHRQRRHRRAQPGQRGPRHRTEPFGDLQADPERRPVLAHQRAGRHL